ncbi:hypothetical protein CWB96_13600 [Pseudoalteromonas citrea]|uniref:DUF3466 domain-containing protein n=1 Tax=Pseudoalteromonas citrea TaxID=43655 RepID=A0A5S3XMN1_9GAMM|nr:DUF3466 family protein [Pseudoalteromonas citrea]TMP41913.1 hypothetical protein CWB97_13175 [Pseudoalteromonas citrea]TMP57210.1 hypothetical protein CWB96_13600 [Pseudoalteromonas citrea]
MKHTLIAAGIFAGLSGQALAATYQLTELPRHNGAANTIISDANENGKVIGTASHIYNLPIDVSYIDFDDSRIKNAYDAEKRRYELIDETITFTLEDVQNGATATNADANVFMIGFLSGLSGSSEYQKLEDRIGISFDAEFADEQVLFDVQSPDYDSLTRSVRNYLTAISDDGVIVGWGSAPLLKTQFTPKDETEEDTFFVRDWGTRGIVITPSGEKVTLEPSFTEHGGASIATDIKRMADGSYHVVGYASVGIIQRRQDDFDDRCKGETTPIQACVWAEERRATNFNGSSSFYDLRAYQWTLDDNFIVTGAEEIGVGAVRRDDEESNIYSVAMATNNVGITVGYSIARYDDKINSLVVPGYFQDGQFTDISEKDEWYKTGKAVDVNNSNVIVGYRAKSSQGSPFDTVGFYYDMTTQKINDIPTYFTGSETAINDINNTGYVVGQGEVEKSGTNRRREGFLYKLGDESIVNINSLLPCKDANGDAYPYTIAEAIKITDSNTIYAIAVKTEERRNRLGEVETDSKGEVEYESVTVPVMLTPISGEVEDCTPPEAETYERQSGTAYWLSLLSMPFIWLRRKKKMSI